jgi:hypothetical protein
MATIALPICELIPVVDEAKERTRCVVVCSQAERADTLTLWRIARKTLGLRHQFAHITRRQGHLITTLIERDFSTVPVEDMRSIATSIVFPRLVFAPQRAASEKSLGPMAFPAFGTFSGGRRYPVQGLCPILCPPYVKNHRIW